MREFDLPKVYNWEKASTKIPTIYKALLTQTGTADPVATVFENTLKTNIIWTRSIAGEYTGTLEGGEFNDTSFILATITKPTGAFLIYGYTSGSVLTVLTKDVAGVADDLDGTAYIEVQVYI
jgi:hypothetical protein